MKYKRGFPESAQLVVVDDEDQNLYLFKDHFGDHFNLKLFQNPSKASQHVRENPKVLLVVTDQSMPEVKGQDLAERVKSERAYLNCIMVTANPENDKNLMYSSLRHKFFFDFLQKPIDFENRHAELLDLFEQAMVGSFKAFKNTRYTEASEAFTATPITMQEHDHIKKLVSANFSKELKLEAGLSEVTILKRVDGIFVEIASLEKHENGSWMIGIEEHLSHRLINSSESVRAMITRRELGDVFNAVLNSKEFENQKKALVA
ncbi:MAG: hypothetical protein C5B49_15175 [Bdellovibrio sp.]|nr:MAG: hypothetical protein C5B49_15175 [Bdellovibrio sp.]